MTHKIKDSTLDDALKFHLDTIANRDLDSFETTIVSDGRLRVILPNGHLIEGFEAVMAFHRNWFSDPDWSMVVTTRKTFLATDMGYAFCEVTYNDLNEEGQPYQLNYWLTLTFIREDGRWLLIHDQNTLLK